MRRPIVSVLSLLVAVLVLAAGLYAAEPVGFRVTASDAQKGLVSAQDAEGNIIQFTLEDPALLKHVKVGQQIVPNLSGGTVGIIVDVPFKMVQRKAGQAEPAGGLAVDPAEPVGKPAEPVGKPAEPVGKPQLDNAEPVSAAQMDPAEPVSNPQVDTAEPAGAVQVDPAEPVGATGSAAKAETPDAGQGRQRFVSTPNAQLKGRLGRLVIDYPNAEKVETRWDVYAAADPDKAVKGGYGETTVDLMPGEYIVEIASVRVDNVPITSRTDTRVRVGVLRVNAGEGTRIDVLDTQKKKLVGGYGTMVIGLPVGPVRVEIAGQQQEVQIEEGKVTDF